MSAAFDPAIGSGPHQSLGRSETLIEHQTRPASSRASPNSGSSSTNPACPDNLSGRMVPTRYFGVDRPEFYLGLVLLIAGLVAGVLANQKPVGGAIVDAPAFKGVRLSEHVLVSDGSAVAESGLSVGDGVKALSAQAVSKSRKPRANTRSRSQVGHLIRTFLQLGRFRHTLPDHDYHFVGPRSAVVVQRDLHDGVVGNRGGGRETNLVDQNIRSFGFQNGVLGVRNLNDGNPHTNKGDHDHYPIWHILFRDPASKLLMFTLSFGAGSWWLGVRALDWTRIGNQDWGLPVGIGLIALSVLALLPWRNPYGKTKSYRTRKNRQFSGHWCGTMRRPEALYKMGEIR